jgi:ribosomal protein S18 acetylase RimI-like enzyme
MPAPSIRESTPADLDALATVLRRAWRVAYRDLLPPAYVAAPPKEALVSRFRDLYRTGDARIAVATRGGTIEGFVTYGRSRDGDAAEHVGEVRTIYVDPGSWRSGVGRALLEHAMLDLQRDGFSEVTVWSAADNDRANTFYDSQGFRLDGGKQRREQFGDVQELRYRRKLDNAKAAQP